MKRTRAPRAPQAYLSIYGMSFRSKVVVRNFPASLTGEKFQQFLQPWDAWINYATLHPAKPAKGARAFINFTEASTLLHFAQHCGENPFIDDQGQSHQLSVEFAPYQVIPAPSTRHNPMCGTLERDEDFNRFLESISGEAKDDGKAEPALPLDEQVEKMIALERELNPWKYDKKLVRSTALLEHLKGLGKTNQKAKAVTAAATKGKESVIMPRSDDVEEKSKVKKKKQKKKSKSKETLNPASPPVATPSKVSEGLAPPTAAAMTSKKKKGKSRGGKDGKLEAQLEPASPAGPFKILKKPNPTPTDDGKVFTLDRNNATASLAELPERRPCRVKPSDVSLGSSDQAQPNAHSESLLFKATLGASVSQSGTTDSSSNQGKTRKFVFKKKDSSGLAALPPNSASPTGSSPAPTTPLESSVIRFSSKPQGSRPVKKPATRLSAALTTVESESPSNLE